MNNIQEMDWAEDNWHGHTGMDSSCDYCIVNEKVVEVSKDKPEAGTKNEDANEQE